MGSERSFTVMTKCKHNTVSWNSCIQSAPSQPVSLKLILILSSHLKCIFP